MLFLGIVACTLSELLFQNDASVSSELYTNLYTLYTGCAREYTETLYTHYYVNFYTRQSSTKSSAVPRRWFSFIFACCFRYITAITSRFFFHNGTTSHGRLFAQQQFLLTISQNRKNCYHVRIVDFH